MATFILTWNPDQWPFDEDDYQRAVESTAAGHLTKDAWSVGNRLGGINLGDRAFLLRQHRDRGIVASGEFTSEVYQDRHWDASDRDANYADVQWDNLLDLEDRLPIEELKRRVSRVSWDRLQASGVQIREDAATSVEELWEAHLKTVGRQTTWLPEEVPSSEMYREGAIQRVMVNRYERDPRARDACLSHWGYDCAVCGFNFARAYGSIGDEFIYVHHLRELSSLGGDYEINPVEDLRPVCPNCHAMLHRQRPAFSIAQLRRRLRGRAGGLAGESTSS
jgi:5-methylcytosine-specific restriction protein A